MGLDLDVDLLSRLRGFYDAGASLLDAMRLEDWAGLFAEDARYRLISRENYDSGLPHATIYCQGIAMIRDRVSSIRQAVIYEDRHLRRMIGGVVIDGREGNMISAHASVMVIESFIDKLPEISMIGRYVDRLIDDGGNLVIHSRDCVFDNYWIRRSVVIPV